MGCTPIRTSLPLAGSSPPPPALPCLPARPQTNVGRQLKEMLQIPDQSKIGFMAHSDAKRDDRRAKERYTV